jgi:hypothetical protein
LRAGFTVGVFGRLSVARMPSGWFCVHEQTWRVFVSEHYFRDAESALRFFETERRRYKLGFDYEKVDDDVEATAKRLDRASASADSLVKAVAILLATQVGYDVQTADRRVIVRVLEDTRYAVDVRQEPPMPRYDEVFHSRANARAAARDFLQKAGAQSGDHAGVGARRGRTTKRG